MRSEKKSQDSNQLNNSIQSQGDTNISNCTFNYADGEADFGIISDIFKHIFDSRIEKVDIAKTKKSDKFLMLKDKIKKNFFSEDELARTHNDFTLLWSHKEKIQRFLEIEEENRPGNITALIDMVITDYCNINDKALTAPVEEMKIIDKMVEQYVPKDKQKNPEYFAVSKALILYFFEMCYFGNKTDNEEESCRSLFD